MANAINFEIINASDSDWASKINRNLAKAAAHTHDDQDGTGFEVNLDSIASVSDIVFRKGDNNALTIFSASSLSFTNLTENILSNRTLFVKNNELCFSNGIGVTVQITSNGTLNVNTVGGSGFTGNLSIHGASVTYVSATSKYHFFGNAGSPTTINCGDVRFQDSTIGVCFPTDSALFNNLQISNFSPVANGNYLFHGTEPYSPTLTALPFSLFATTPLLAQQNIAQVFGSGSQRLIQTGYRTNLFCFVNGMLSYVDASGTNIYNYFQYPISIGPGGEYYFTAVDTQRSPGILYGCYNRGSTGLNPNYISNFGVLTFSAGTRFSNKNFTVLPWYPTRTR